MSMKNLAIILFIVLFAGSLYTLTLKGVRGNPAPETIKATLEEAPKPFELSPERGRFAHVMALADNHEYALSQDLGEFVYPDVGWYKGKFYSYFAPGISYMAVPFYLLGKHYNLSQVFTFGFVSLMSIFALVFIYLISRNILRMSTWASLLAVVIFAFGSTAWSYAGTLYQHHLTVLFSLSAFYAVWKYKQSPKFGWVWGVWVWLAYALALTIDYPNALLLLPVVIYFLCVSIQTNGDNQRLHIRLRPAFIITAMCFVLVTGLHLYHNYHEFGSWKRLSGSLVGYTSIKNKGWENLPVSEIEKNIASQQTTKDNVAGFFSEEKLPNSFGTLMFSKDRGLLFYGPIFLLGIFGILLLLRKLNLETGTLVALIGVNVFLYSSWGDPWGGWAFGTRYLIPSMSILAMFAAYWISRRRWGIVRKLLALLLFAYSSAVALLGALTTNAIPPRVEADYLHTGYNYLLNLKYLNDNRSGSFIYNTYIHQFMSLREYFLWIYIAVLGIVIVLLFIVPLFSRNNVIETQGGPHA